MRALHMASAVGNLDIVHFLVTMGVSVNDPENGNHLPLHEAIMNSRLNIVEYLIDAGADAKAVGDGQATMLHYTANYCDNIEIAKTLIDAGAFVDKADFAGVTPLHCAARCDWIDMVELLCQNGAHPESKDVCGMTPLHVAAESGSCSCARYLILEQNVSLDRVNNSGVSPYALALKFAHCKIAELILSAGYMPTIKDLYVGEEALDQRPINRNDNLHKKLLKDTRDLLTKVPSLVDMSSNTIRKHLGRDVSTNVRRLELPNVLSDKICLAHLRC